MQQSRSPPSLTSMLLQRAARKALLRARLPCWRQCQSLAIPLQACRDPQAGCTGKETFSRRSQKMRARKKLRRRRKKRCVLLSLGSLFFCSFSCYSSRLTPLPTRHPFPTILQSKLASMSPEELAEHQREVEAEQKREVRRQRMLGQQLGSYGAATRGGARGRGFPRGGARGGGSSSSSGGGGGGGGK